VISATGIQTRRDCKTTLNPGGFFHKRTKNMGFLDDLLGKLTGGGSAPSGNLAALAPVVMEMLQNHPGGLDGLVKSFENQGLGNLISSWIGTGQKLPVSTDQLQNVLGSDTIRNLAAKAGIPADQAGSALSQLLPQLVDQATPNGKIE
jgi:uncharacterized protein YidB (DUF937 family)